MSVVALNPSTAILSKIASAVAAEGSWAWASQSSKCPALSNTPSVIWYLNYDLYYSNFDGNGVVEELWISAPQRHHSRRKRVNITPFSGHLLITTTIPNFHIFASAVAAEDSCEWASQSSKCPALSNTPSVIRCLNYSLIINTRILMGMKSSFNGNRYYNEWKNQTYPLGKWWSATWLQIDIKCTCTMRTT